MIGTYVYRARKDRGWTQADLAEMSGVPQNHISAIERGKIPNLSVTTATKLASAFGIPVDDLLAGNVDAGQSSGQESGDLLVWQRAIDLAGRGNLTVDELAERAEIPKPLMLEFLRGNARPMSLQNIAHLATALGTSTDYLLGLTDDTTPPGPRARAEQPSTDDPSAQRNGTVPDIAELFDKLPDHDRRLILALIERAVFLREELP